MPDQAQISVLMRRALELRETGALPEAEALCRRILDIDPGHEDAGQALCRHRAAARAA